MGKSCGTAGSVSGPSPRQESRTLAFLLAIDWDGKQLHLVSARTQRKGVQVRSAATWDMGGDLTVATAEAVGKRLRDYLKAEGVAATAAVVSVGREKVI